MPFTRSHLPCRPAGRSIAAALMLVAATLAQAGSQFPDLATTAIVPPYPSAGTTFTVSHTHSNTPTAAADAVINIILDQDWTFLASTCSGFAQHEPGYARGLAQIAAGDSLECHTSFSIPAAFSGPVQVTAQAIDLTDPNTANNTANAAAQVVRLRVNTTSDGFDFQAGDGVCRHSAEGFAICSLRAAINEANAMAGRQRIEIPWNASTHALTRQGPDTEYWGDLDITDSVILDGIPNADGALPVIGATFAITPDRVLDIDVPQGGLVIIQHLSLAGLGQAIPGHGGVMRHLGGTLSLTDVDVVDGVSSQRGGGVYLADFAALNNTRVRENAATDGGGIAIVLPGNQSITIQDSEFRDNGASGNGGAVYLQGGTLELRRSLLAHNLADSGGGIYAGMTALRVENSTLSSNIADSNGGGLYAITAIPQLRFSTFANNAAAPGNNAAGLGGGIYLDAFAGVQIGSSILSGNTAQTRPSGPFTVPYAAACFGSPVSLGHNAVQAVSLDSQCNWTSATGDSVDTFAQIGPLADNGGLTQTHALIAGAAEIDGGDPACAGNNGALAQDQRLVARPADGDSDGNARCDKGAFEFLPQRLLEIVLHGAGSGVVTSDPAGIDCGADCMANFDDGTEVTLTANAAPGSRFVAWEHSCGGTGPCTLTLTTPVTVLGARFEPLLDEIFANDFE